MAKKENPERVAQIKTAIASIIGISSKSWTSSKDYPLSTICKDAGLDKNWTQAVTAALRENSLFEVEGKASGLKYKFKGDILSDPDFMVANVRKHYALLTEKYSKKERPSKTKRTDY